MPPPTLTVNSRLARWLLLEQDEQKKQAGEKAWQTPPILSLSAWLRNVWTESWPAQYLLSPLQCEKIWEQIIVQDSARLDLLHLQGVASKASQAFTLIHEYRLPRNPKLYAMTDEAKTFLSWTKKYDRRLSSLGALDPCMLMDAVRNSMQDGNIPIPPALRVMGFEEQNPQLKFFIDFLLEKGTRVDFLSPVPTPEILEDKLNDGTAHVREYENRQAEAEACARWVRSIFQPGKLIGIVVPELEKYRTLLKRELSSELVPESIFSLDEQVFNISLAPPLSQEPMIKMALDLLTVKTATVPIATFLSFIQSPFLGYTFPPMQEISDLERKLRRKRVLSISLDKLSSYGSIAQVDQLAERLKSWTLNNKRVLPGKWAEELTELLKITGWPGKSEASADQQSVLSKRYQAFEAWKDCLNQLCSLNQILGPVNRLEAINHLASIARSTPFQTKTPEYSIQVIGLLESSGMQFDHLWVMGCHSEALPTHPEPNPFIPYEIRNKFSIPRSNPQRELIFAEQSLSRLLMAAPEVHFSFPLHEGDMDMKISPLLKGFAKVDEAPCASRRIKDQVLALNDLEEFTESAFSPATDSEKTLFATRGMASGYSLVKDQVDCPFRAFARHRLNSEHYPAPEVDFDNLDRGNVIHKALELFWEKTVDLKNLLKILLKGTLKQELDQYVREALKICSERTAGQTQFNQLEIERNVRVIHDWLRDVESKRPDFKVLHNEEGVEINLSGIKLKLRIDRIDEIPDKGLLLIDYKTGRDAKTTDWFAEKIRAPQLPLYTLAKPPAGLAYGHLVIGKPEFKGTTIPGLPLGEFKNQDFTKASGYSSWEELLDYWKNNLNAVADEFLQGNHRVSPINKGEPCLHCEFGSLCRIQATSRGGG
ncbi:MAG: PD-(D/E)XK nuclease family protein [Nitrospinae bacterium]|nr:PD-(D/E)XK nuclease family protein [Nitrospinota bacterium]MBL7020034.1 PD-(D/E)XK nuclease family protein [Nitrospinaceae bacterium]